MYIGKNLKKSDCAIVGAFNSLTWLGMTADYKELEFVAKEYYEYTSKNGLKIEYLHGFLEILGVSVNLQERATIKDAARKLSAGQAALAIVTPKDSMECHVVFLKPNDGSIEVLNSDMNWGELVESFMQGDINLVISSVNRVAA